MASIHKDGADATWRAAVTCIVGSARTQVKKTTGTTDRKLARRIADFLEELAGGLITAEEAHKFIAKIQEARAKRAARRAGDDLLRMTTGHGLGGESLRTFAEGWLARTQGEVVVRSFEKYRTAVDRFLEVIGERADANLQEIEMRDIISFRDALAKRLAPSSVNVEMKIIRSMFTAAERDLLISRNPARLVKSLKVTPGVETRRAFTIKELGRIYAVTSGEMRGLFLAGLFTGQRLGDVARWRWVNVDFEREEIRFTTRKTGRRQIIPMAGPLRDWLLIEGSPGDDPTAPVFPESLAAVDGMRDGSVGILSNRFYRVLVDAGLAPIRSHKKKRLRQRARRAAPNQHAGVSFLAV